MKRYPYTKGYSLVEVLVAVAILMIAIVGPITIAAKSLQSAQYARQQNTAFFLAQEGITIANTLRNDAGLFAYVNPGADPWAWTGESSLGPCFDTTGCNIDFRDDSLLNNVSDCGDSADACVLKFDKDAPRAAYQMVQGENTPFTRIITFSFASPDEVVVKSNVTWGSGLLGDDQVVTFSTSLFNLYK